MKNILIPTDFSENSWNAIEYALNLCEKSPCNIHLLHVVRITGYVGDDYGTLSVNETISETLLKDAKHQLQKIEKRIEKLPFDTVHNFVLSAIYGLLIGVIRNEVKEKEIDLIIMGTKGTSGLKEVILGSNTGDIITKVQCRVLAVPEDAKFHKPKEIVLPTDYNIFYGGTILNTILEMAYLYNSRIRILHVAKMNEKLNEGQKKNKELLEDYFKDVEHSFHTITNNKLEAAIQCFIESRDIDMIAMVAKHLNFFQQILFKPTVEEISYHTNVPFLVLHE